MFNSMFLSSILQFILLFYASILAKFKNDWTLKNKNIIFVFNAK